MPFIQKHTVNCAFYGPDQNIYMVFKNYVDKIDCASFHFNFILLRMASGEAETSNKFMFTKNNMKLLSLNFILKTFGWINLYVFNK